MSESTIAASIVIAEESSPSQDQSTSTVVDTHSSTVQPTRLVEVKLDKRFFRLEHPDLEKPRDLDPVEKIALEKLNAQITVQATLRQETCWYAECDRPALVHVRLVCFDMKGDKAAAIQHMQISTADYPGPVPGFCLRHETSGPPELAAAVYWDRPEVAWGVKPTRWWVEFTDGLKQGGECVLFDPEQRLPIITES